MTHYNLRIYPQTEPLRGTISVPGDKSISHRAVLLAALADGASHVRNWLPAGDTLATLRAAEALGVQIKREEKGSQSWDLQIAGRGLYGLQPPAGAIDCENAGTCMRLLAGILAGQRFPSTIDGSEQLRRRPMQRIVTPLRAMGAAIDSRQGNAPLQIRPATLQGITYQMPVASAQVKSAILLAGLYAAGPVRLQQPAPARDHTERMLQAMGVSLSVEDGWISLPHEKERRLHPLTLVVPGDISSAAFPLVAAAVVPDSEVKIRQVGLNGTRTGLLQLLQQMGRGIVVAGRQESAGEPAGDLHLHATPLQATEAAGSVVVRAIDELPIWAVAASQATGRSCVREAAELRVKEVDRIALLAQELGRMGAVIEEQPDGFCVEGPTKLQGAVVDSHGDHRLGMALAVAALVAGGPTLIKNGDCIADSFPGFVETMRKLGARMEWVTP